jgi:hypothetical protein
MFIQTIKNELIQNIKNIIGWKTKRKIVVFSVDDYGNVRVGSKQARENMNTAGLKILSRFDQFDCLENEQDLLALYEVLTSVKDGNNNYAVFTPFAMSANINFEKVIDSGYKEFYYELLPETLNKLAGYEKVYGLIKDGISNRIFLPQFHGREHLNLKVFKENLLSKDRDTINAINSRSYTSISINKYQTISYTAAFEFDKFEENHTFNTVIKEGLDSFEKVYGYRSVHFNSPGGGEHPYIHKALLQSGVKYIDTPWIKNQHQGEGVYKKVINYTGKKSGLGQTYLVRNCVFEPTADSTIDAVALCMKQIEYAFKWNRAANISSHRVNYCGHIDPQNRETGLKALKQLLNAIVIRWPDVEFMASNELGDLISGSDSA